jgi:hypothetical protein
LVAATVIGAAALMDLNLALAFGIVAVVDGAWGIWRTGPGLRRVLIGGAS